MPLRRRPPEPSPRVRALLEAAGRDRTGRRDSLGQLGSVGKAGPLRSNEPLGQLGPWLPPGPEGPVGAAPPKPAGRHRRPQPSVSPFMTLPQSLRGARVGTPRTAIVGLLLVVALAML